MTDNAEDVHFATQAQAADWFGVQPATLAKNWRSQQRMPWGDDGGSAQEIARWLAKKFGERNASTPETESRKEAETRKTLADARLKELTYDRLSGNLVPLDTVQMECSELLTRFRDRVMRIPEGLKPMLPREHADEIVRAVDGQLRLALGALENAMDQLEDTLQDGEAEQDASGDA